jgi:molybdopterin-dependent oxidoreductase alpha subunit
VASKVGFKNFYQSIISKNTCKTCALGMGGQKGGMTNEVSSFPEICKKSIQAQLTDIQKEIPQTFFKKQSITDFRKTSPRELERLGRLNTPLFKSGDSNHYNPIGWDDALEKIIKRLRTTSPDRSFFYSSGRSSNEAAFLLQLFVRAYGSNNINNCSYYCHQASGVGLGSTIGSGTATIVLEDLKQSDMIWVIGANPASNHPRLLTELLHCRRKKGKVVIVNPIKEPGLVRFRVPSDWKSMLLGDNKIATDYVQPNIGGDIALFQGIAKELIENENIDKQFIEKHTNGFEIFAHEIRKTPWDNITLSSGVNRPQIKRLAKLYKDAKNVVFTWSMGITQHVHGVENVESIVNLALLRGMIGKKNAGLLPLRGHSNVQGVGSMGVTPELKKKILINFEKQMGINVPKSMGLDTIGCLKASYNHKMDFAFLLGGNLFAATPNQKFAEKALRNIPFKVFVSTTLNQSHFFGVGEETVILPVAARDEEKQPTTQESMFNFVRISDGGIVRLSNVKSEVDIITDIATGVLGNKKIDFSAFKKHQDIRKAIGHIIPGFDKMSTIDRTKEEFQIGDRTFYDPKFATHDNKAIFKTITIPEQPVMNGQFKMSSIRSDGQFNTIVYEDEDTFRGINQRWVVMMNQDDMLNLKLKENDKVNLYNETDIMKKVKVQCFDIAKGNVAIFFPEGNVLIPSITDPRSKTPSFKSTLVKISPIS